MKTSLSAVAIAIVLVGAAASPALALTLPTIRCQEAIAKTATKFVGGVAKLEQRCDEGNIASPGTCVAPDAAAAAKLRAKLASGIEQRCSDPQLLAALGFPGPCADPNPGDGFTVSDLVACIDASHTTGVDAIFALLIDSTTTGPLTDGQATCQRAVDAGGVHFASKLLPAIQKCRDRILQCPIGVFCIAPADCATDDPATVATIAKLRQTFRTRITRGCTDAEALALRLCAPDQSSASEAADCLSDGIQKIVDDPVQTDPPDLIDYEYSRPPICGDNHVNQPTEECDGTDDAACPGECGVPDGFFACLCKNVPRLRVVEHANADLDLGWSGIHHDQHVVEGGGYVADLWDCDGLTDVVCTVGPTCSAPPHAACGASAGAPYTNGDDLCAALGEGTCRKTSGGATGPHCFLDVQQECATDEQCPTFGDRCVHVPSGPPLPVSSGGISVCIESTFTEDVVGTIDVASGAGSVRARRQLLTRLGAAVDRPCPTCGGFCAAPVPSDGGIGGRTACATDAECPQSFCVLDAVCSAGPNADRACRPSPPFGGPTGAFGATSIDCPSAGEPVGTLDVLAAPSTTGTTTLTANQPCAGSPTIGPTCFHGSNDERPCASDADCPGGACHDQCFCPPDASAPERPNACNAACVVPGDASPDGEPCAVDGDCPGGFCHPFDCRRNVTDHDSAQEGVCTAGPTFQHCSTTTAQPCSDDAACAAPMCPACEPGETCVSTPLECFVNGQILRQGYAGVPDRVTAAVFCIPPATSAGVNVTTGLSGPGALTQPETTMVVGF